MLIVSGDVGGTNTRLQITDFKTDKRFTVHAREKYSNHEFKSFTDIITTFLNKNKMDNAQISGACFAVAGPIIQGTVKFTNLPWYLDEKQLREELPFKFIHLMNDFEAIGYGIETLTPDLCHPLQKGEGVPNTTRALIGAGTGLGVGISIYNGQRFQVLATEGGHVDFAPVDDIQFALLQHLKKKLHRVSVERAVSGPGIVNIYHFVRENPIFNETENPALKLALFQKEDPAASITEFAVKEHDPMAMRALDLFIRIYGAAAGNLALSTLPYAGLYIVGGIAPKLLPQLLDGRFLRAFSDKGRMSNLLSTIPIYIVLDPYVGLQGAANFALMANTL